MGAAFTAVPAMTSLTYYIPSICEVARPALGMVSPDRDGIAGSYPHPRPLPARGRGAIEPRHWMWSGRGSNQKSMELDIPRETAPSDTAHFSPPPCGEGSGVGVNKGNANESGQT